MNPVAFYAPLKAPDHPNPSGDRALARALMTALTDAGFCPDLASDLRTLERTGNSATQADLIRKANALIPDLIARGKEAGWRLWVTYHNYYKAPDLLGPKVSAGLSIPYIQIESTRARKRLSGGWARFARIAEDAADAAAVIFYFTERDAQALRAYGPPDQTIAYLRPFLDRPNLPPPSGRHGGMLAVGMMRPGDKLASYSLIAQMLEEMQGSWRLDIAGDGAARAEVDALMAPFGDRVQFLGQLDADGLAKAYAEATVMVWPGVNEAIGLAYLEAQAAGIPVLAQDRPGLREVLAPNLPRPAPEDGPKALARAAETLLSTPPDAEVLRAHVEQHHLRPAATHTLAHYLHPLIGSET